MHQHSHREFLSFLWNSSVRFVCLCVRVFSVQPVNCCFVFELALFAWATLSSPPPRFCSQNTYWKRQTKEELTEFFVFIHSVWVRMCHFWSLSLRASFSFLLCCVRFALVSVYSICIKQLYQITLQPGSVTLDWSSFRQKFSQLIRCFVSVKVFYSVFKTFLDNLRFLLAIVFFSCCLQYKILVQQIKSKTKTVFSQPHRGSEYFSGKQRTIIVFYSVLNQTG